MKHYSYLSLILVILPSAYFFMTRVYWLMLEGSFHRFFQSLFALLALGIACSFFLRKQTL